MSTQNYTVEQVRAIAANIKNHHVLEISYISWSETKSNRIKIHSPRFKQTIFIPYTGVYPNTFEHAIEWLLSSGFEIVGQGEGKACYYVITNTFKPLK